MIKKLTANDYLTPFQNMSIVEQRMYLQKVKDWNDKSAPMILRHSVDADAVFQNILQCSAAWNDSEQQALADGLKLLTALAKTEGSWLPEAAYVKSSGRTIRWMVKTLLNVATCNTTPELANVKKEKTATTDAAEADKPIQPTTTIPIRPKHIDQYVHLLPRKTQERAAGVKDLLEQIDFARENARLLMNDENSLPADRAKWAKMASDCDKEVRKIYKELDREWEKLVKSNRVVEDELGNVRIIPANQTNGTKQLAESGEQLSDLPLTGENEQLTGGETTQQPNKLNLRRQLRKWLVDTRRGNGNTREEHIKKWVANYKEYLTIEGPEAAKDSKIAAAADHYGISITGKTARAKQQKPINT